MYIWKNIYFEILGGSKSDLELWSLEQNFSESPIDYIFAIRFIKKKIDPS